MGNFHSAHIDCLIEKQTDLEPGESLRGTILLDVNDSQAVQQHFDGITILVAGVEYMHIPAGDADENGTVIPTSKVIKVKSVIKLSDGDTTQGKHEIPFEVKLPTYQEHEEHYETFRKAATSSSVQEALDSRPALRRCEDSEASSASSSSSYSAMSDFSDLSVSPYCTSSKVFVHKEDIPETDETMTTTITTTTTIVYHVKAILKRKKHVPLSVDTDIKCHARSVEAIP
jgi:hypothetical protein